MHHLPLAGSPPLDLEAEVLADTSISGEPTSYKEKSGRPWKRWNALGRTREELFSRNGPKCVSNPDWVGDAQCGSAHCRCNKAHSSTMAGEDTWLSLRLVQVLSGHGCFGRYLCHVARRELMTVCHECGGADDTAQHVLKAAISAMAMAVF